MTIQRYQEQVLPLQVFELRRGPALLEHRVTQGTAQALQYCRPGQEGQLLRRELGEQFSL